MKNRTTV